MAKIQPNAANCMVGPTASNSISVTGFRSSMDSPRSPRTANAVHLALVLIGGLAGAWVGWELGLLLYSEAL